MIVTIDSTLDRYYELAGLAKDRQLTKEESSEMDFVESILIPEYNSLLAKKSTAIFRDLPHQFNIAGRDIGTGNMDPLFCTRKLADLRRKSQFLDSKVKSICTDPESARAVLLDYAMSTDIGDGNIAQKVKDDFEVYSHLMDAISSDSFEQTLAADDTINWGLDYLIQMTKGYIRISGDNSAEDALKMLISNQEEYSLAKGALEFMKKDGVKDADERINSLNNRYRRILKEAKLGLDERIAGMGLRQVFNKIKGYVDQYREDVYPDIAERQRNLLSQFRAFHNEQRGHIDPLSLDYANIAGELMNGNSFSAFEREYILRSIVSHPGYKEFSEILEEIKEDANSINKKVAKAKASAGKDNGKKYEALKADAERQRGDIICNVMADNSWQGEFEIRYPFAVIGHLREDEEYGDVNFARLVGVPEERAAELFPGRDYIISAPAERKGMFSTIFGWFSNSSGKNN